MIIIHEIIYFLLYHSILASIVGTLETPDDLFNDVANKILPEQLQSMSINETHVKIWFDQIDVGVPITTAVVREVSAPGISYFFGLYFIIEKPLNSSRAIDFLHPHIRIINRFLSKIKTLSYIAGMAYVPPLPSNWSQVSEENFRAGIGAKLDDILKSLIFDAIIVVFVFNNKRESLVTILTDICYVPIVYWDYDLKPDNNGKDLNDILFHEIVQLIEGCYGPCGAGACLVLEENPVKNLSQEQIQCIVTSLQLNEPVCIKKPPEDVFVPVCGNGIIENTESCDCLHPLECGSKCDTNCNLRQKARGGTNRFFILTVSAVIIASIVFALSLILFFYFKRRNNLESRNSGIGIPHGGSKTELNIPNQAKLKDWGLTSTLAETTLRDPSKSKLELGIKEIVSSDRSQSKINAVSKESFTAKNIISVDRLQSTTDAMSFERLASKIASKDRSQSKISVTSKERLKPRSITSKERTKSKTNASSKESLISKNISSTKVPKSKLPVDLAKSIQPKKTSSSKSVGKASLISPKTVSSKSLPKSKAQNKTQKDDLERNSFK
ncbi:uncharacterized protein LOC107371219 isoform X1 [Tetranychus urticae]|uniref:uncharacterized protein LOC107371219 isoform X1 n=1 Tax=Tetranychus urticae TaxID=32264 RepID=UPI00077BE361|nr:uncharacterized protein LOC107371219 isoform X1 [Tetranychus urticae]XP_015794725.1 uncharacterized protein LOC107371219 isoform X1 [Tetranychus urticae]XP_015794726.1 uncharacterized protein LOC107371219 isoform X1 [Tetranychus urticae]XP_015794727.1 uncharacterized protein LOC107371219 isoform X1 [Tetranychus urticae]